MSVADVMGASSRLFPRLKAEGVSLATLQRLVAWCKQAWPNGAWDALLR